MKFEGLVGRLKGSHDRFATFIDCNGSRFSRSHDQLFNDVMWLIGELQKASVPLGAKIGIMGGNSYQFMAVDLAVSEYGCISVVFSDAHKNESLDELIEKYEISLMFIDKKSGVGVEAESGVVFYGASDFISESFASDFTFCDQNKSVDADVFSLSFSSGTTGGLKALVTSRKGTEKVISQLIDAFQVTREDTHFSFLPLSYFQQRVLNYMCLHVGANVLVVSPERIFSELPSSGATFVVAPPSFHEAVYKMTCALSRIRNDGKSVVGEVIGNNMRFMITAMAPISKKIIDYFWDNNVNLYQTYAITEAGFATWNNFTINKNGSVGVEAEPGTLKILDDGELVIYRNNPVTLGYFGVSKEIEMETFRTDGGIATGDIVVRDGEGFYEIVGRKKSVIITKGGEKYHPEGVEQSLVACIDAEGFKVIVVGGDPIGHNVAIFFLDNRAHWASGIAESAFAKGISDFNDAVENYKQIRRFVISDNDLSYANGLLTRNLKYNRTGVKSALLETGLGKSFSI